MKKLFLLSLVAISTALTLRGENLTTKDGKVYKNIKFFTASPAGVDIEYKKNGQPFLRHFAFSNLPEDIQKKFKYSPARAKEYLVRLKNINKKALKKYNAKLLKLAKNSKIDKDKREYRLNLRAQIEAGAINVVLNVSEIKKNGIIAYASFENSTLTSGHLGQIFVFNMGGGNGEQVAALLYPTGKNIDGCTAYSPYLDVAVNIAMQD